MFLHRNGRLITAVCAALTIHAALFFARIHSTPRITPPKPLQIQHISVSLGARPLQKEPMVQEVPEPVAKEPAKRPPVPEVEQLSEPPQKPEPIQEPLPEKKAVVKKDIPVKQLKTQSKAKKRIAAAKQAQPPPIPLPLVTEPGEELSTAKASPRILQKASPLYQINPPPKYPALARRRGWEGTVSIEVLVDEYGNPTELKLLKSSSHALLDKAALKAVRRWRFRPGSIDGTPQKMTVRVPVRFRIRD